MADLSVIGHGTSHAYRQMCRSRKQHSHNIWNLIWTSRVFGHQSQFRRPDRILDGIWNDTKPIARGASYISAHYNITFECCFAASLGLDLLRCKRSSPTSCAMEYQCATFSNLIFSGFWQGSAQSLQPGSVSRPSKVTSAEDIAQKWKVNQQYLLQVCHARDCGYVRDIF